MYPYVSRCEKLNHQNSKKSFTTGEQSMRKKRRDDSKQQEVKKNKCFANEEIPKHYQQLKSDIDAVMTLKHFKDIIPYPKSLGPCERFILQNIQITRQTFNARVFDTTYFHLTHPNLSP